MESAVPVSFGGWDDFTAGSIWEQVRLTGSIQETRQPLNVATSGENRWTTLAERPWPTFAENRWTTFGRILTLAEKYGVRIVGVFGSYVRQEQRPDSDLDLLIELDRPFKIHLIGLVELEDTWARREDILDAMNKAEALLDGLAFHSSKPIFESIMRSCGLPSSSILALGRLMRCCLASITTRTSGKASITAA